MFFFVTKGLTSYYYVTTRYCCLLVRLYYFQRLTSSHCSHWNKSCSVVVRTYHHARWIKLLFVCAFASCCWVFVQLHRTNTTHTAVNQQRKKLLVLRTYKSTNFSEWLSKHDKNIYSSETDWHECFLLMNVKALFGIKKTKCNVF